MANEPAEHDPAPDIADLEGLYYKALGRANAALSSFEGDDLVMALSLQAHNAILDHDAVVLKSVTAHLRRVACAERAKSEADRMATREARPAHPRTDRGPVRAATRRASSERRSSSTRRATRTATASGDPSDPEPSPDAPLAAGVAA